MSSLRALIVAYGGMLPRAVEMVFDTAREVKCKSALSSSEDWILRYIRTYLFYNKVTGVCLLGNARG